MRRLVLLLLLLPLAGCASSPNALGITGPKGSQAGSQPADADGLAPPTSGTRYAPSMRPTTGGGRYWGYD